MRRHLRKAQPHTLRIEVRVQGPDLVAQAEVRLGPLDPAFHIGDGIPALGGVRNRHAGDGHGKLVRLGIADEGLSKLEALLHFNVRHKSLRGLSSHFGNRALCSKLQVLLGFTEDPSRQIALARAGNGELGTLDHPQTFQKALFHRPVSVIRIVIQLQSGRLEGVQQRVLHLHPHFAQCVEEGALAGDAVGREQHGGPRQKALVDLPTFCLVLLLLPFALRQNLAGHPVHSVQLLELLQLLGHHSRVLHELVRLLLEPPQPVLPQGGLESLLLLRIFESLDMGRNLLLVVRCEAIKFVVEPLNFLSF
mmetsp:Transcript_66467/g.111115  ORF Transcript_66467/g.111115 Transcript_66467/m.111115 type:complete len:307 (-) Transcript_66467:129-1049(-)